MKVLVIGGSGFIGTKLSRELHERGHAVTVLSRTPDVESFPEGIQTVRDNVTDYGSIETPFAGHDAVVNLVALSPLFLPAGGNEMHERVHLGGTKNVVNAAEAHGVEKIVQVSVLGADLDGPTAYIRAKGQAETVVRESDLDWVIVRPSVVFGDGGEFVPFTKQLTTPYVTGLPGGGKTRFQPIWIGDFVPILADVVENDTHSGATYELGGPEELTLAEVAKRVYQANRKPVTVFSIPMGIARIGLTIGERIPGFPIGIDQYRSLQFDNTVDENDVRMFDRDPNDLRSIDDYLAERQSSSSMSSQSIWTARPTLLVFAFLAIGWLLPNIVDIYSYGGLPLVVYIPSYLVMLFIYDSPVGLENVVYAIDSIVPSSGEYLWEGGLLVTYYLFAVVATWLGRYLETIGESLKQGGTRDEERERAS